MIRNMFLMNLSAAILSTSVVCGATGEGSDKAKSYSHRRVFTQPLCIEGCFTIGGGYDSKRQHKSSSKQEAFELHHSKDSYAGCRMRVGTAKLSNLTSINGEIQYVAVEKGELLYKGKTYGPGVYVSDSEGTLKPVKS